MSDKLAQSRDIYQVLGVLKDTPGQEIHRRFIKLVMKLLHDLPASGQVEEDLQRLQRFWFAHDILTDPATRTDYDLRLMGIRTGNLEALDDSLSTGGEQKPFVPSWRIGELLQAAGYLEQSELDIACDMHKAVPEMQFGRFLIKQGFIGERHLEAVLIGQVLLRSGQITLSQFRSLMSEAEKSKRNVKEVLLESGYVTKAILEKLG